MYTKIKHLFPSFIRILLRKIIIFIRKVYYTGNAYFCPICNRKSRKFLQYGKNNKSILRYKIISNGKRENCICPNCFSKDRERLLFLFFSYFKNKLYINENSSILHFSPEKTLTNYFFRKHFTNYKTSDFFDKKANFKIDLENTLNHEKKYDLIICNHVLEHIHNDSQALDNINNLLKNGGHAILLTPYSELIDDDIYLGKSLTNKQKLEFYGQNDHVRVYSKKNLIKKIEYAGFDLKLMKREDFCSINKKMGLIEEEKIFLAKKL